MRDFILISKALSDETRVRILMMLSRGELCVCQISDLIKLAPSTISKHLSLLHHARLVNTRKDKRWVYYRLADNGAPCSVKEALKWVQGTLKCEQKIKKDIKSLSKITKISPSKELCK